MLTWNGHGAYDTATQVSVSGPGKRKPKLFNCEQTRKIYSINDNMNQKRIKNWIGYDSWKKIFKTCNNKMEAYQLKTRRSCPQNAKFVTGGILNKPAGWIMNKSYTR